MWDFEVVDVDYLMGEVRLWRGWLEMASWRELEGSLSVLGVICFLVVLGHVAIGEYALWATSCELDLTPRDTGSRQALLITAHPDDEAMFFAPTIMGLQNSGYRVHVLCLTTGNADGLGDIRSVELVRAASHLGIAEEDVTVLDEEELQDGMDEVWSRGAVEEVVRSYLRDSEDSFDVIVTFDAYGVSGHVNHRCCSLGVQEVVALWDEDDLNGRRPVLALLDSVPLWRKFLGRFDLFVSMYTTVGLADRALVYWPNASIVADAMRAHASQYVWFRRLFLLFATYPSINTLTLL